MKMLLTEFKSLFHTDFNISEIHAVRQHWDQRLHCVDLMQAPRRSHGLLLITDHCADYTLPNGETLHAAAGDVILLPKGAHYAVNFLLPPGAAAQPLLINFRLFCPDGTEPSAEFPAVRIAQDDTALLPLFTEAATLYKTGCHPAQLKSVVFRILSLLFPLNEKDECCISYINAHFTEQFSIPQLAKQCALSESVYRRRFRQLTGLSPIQYINQIKIEKACQLLQSGDINPSDISEFLNFYSVSYFYRVFKSVTGCTPNEYRRRSE